MTEHALTVPGRYDEVRKICRFVVDGAAAAGLDEDTLFQLELSCDEAATNIIEHAYGGEGAGKITVRYDVTDRAFTITMVDHGRPFRPEKVPQPPGVSQATGESPEEWSDRLQVGGLGLHFIRRLMDEVRFTFSEVEGNTLVMVKQLD